MSYFIGHRFENHNVLLTFASYVFANGYDFILILAQLSAINILILENWYLVMAQFTCEEIQRNSKEFGRDVHVQISSLNI